MFTRASAFSAALISAASFGVVAATAAAEAPLAPGDRLGRGTRNYRKPSGFDPRINRWTGAPHERRREIARRHRQEAAR